MAYSGTPLFCCFLSLIFTWIVASSASVIQYPGSSFTPQQSNGFWKSGNGSFTFGFKEVATDEYLLCIWYSEDDNKTAVWWANYGEDSLADGSASLNFTDAGNLELLDSNMAVVWSSNTSKLNVSSAQLLDTGNLILVNDTNSTIIWQSLDNLTDTLLLPIDNEGLTISIHQYSPGRPYFLQSRANSTSYILGSFNLQTDANNNLYLHQLLNRLNYDFTFWYANMNTTGNVQIEQNRDDILYDNNNYIGNYSVKRFSLDYDGNLRVYSWEPNSTSWGVLWNGISDLCQVGSPCGAFGLCKVVNNRINCTCPPGYNALDSIDLTQGCYSEVSFNASCSSNATGNGGDLSYNTTMVEVDDYDYYQNDLLPAPYTMDESTCQSSCLSNCLCMAASYKKDGSSHCYLKGSSSTGVLLEGYAYSNNNLFVKVASLVAADGGGGQGSSKVAAAVGGGVAAAVAVVLVAAGLGWWLWRRKGKSVGWMGAGKFRKEEEEDFARGPVRFTYAQLAEATKGFSVMLGEGGFGKVYKGWLAEKKEIGSGTKVVAVKLLKGGDWLEAENERQFRAEVGTLGRIHHINLVDLLGFCTDAGKRLLVYEYLEEGSLDSHVFFPATPAASSTTTSTLSSSSATSATGALPATPNTAPALPWPTRFSIALGTARGISYLHHECHQCILHCDIKPQNILLDGDYRPKVADFGFARPFHHRNDHLTVSAVRGTRGYLAPEWLGSDEISSKADVYSFGVVLLEIARGRSHGFDRWHLRDWAFQCVSSSTSSTKADVDEGMVEGGLQEQLRLLRVGLWCIQHNPSLRPTMSRVVQMLEGTIRVDDPPYPAPLPIAPNLTDSTTSSNNELYSLLSPR